MSAPDVTVVVAVHNTMPYLRECLRSVLRQTIGAQRLEVIAVDDGSTDDSGAELDRWARRHPDTVKVVHQPNSGGPAAPSNRALELATGRYVFFLGADDYLGAEALERLVRTADELDADIVLGRLVGAGGRNVNQAVFAGGNRDDIDLVNSALPWALSNTKLFRRSMLEEHGIRYPEELLVGSDQPFTIRAVTAARRIAVRADYQYYYAVRRTDSSNITYRTSLYGFVESTATIMDTVADVVTDPQARERVLRRHFTWELGKLLGERFLSADEDERQRVQDGIRKLADTYLSESIRTSLDVQHRLRLSVAQRGTAEDLLAVVRHYVERGMTPVTMEDGRCYALLPGFRDPQRNFPDAWYDATATFDQVVAAEPVAVSWTAGGGGKALSVRMRSLIPGLADSDEHPLVALAGDRSGTVTVVPGDDPGAGTLVRAEFALADLMADPEPPGTRRIRFGYEIAGEVRAGEVRGAGPGQVAQLWHRRGLSLFRLRAGLDKNGRLHLATRRLTLRTVARRLLKGAPGRIARRLMPTLQGGKTRA